MKLRVPKETVAVLRMPTRIDDILALIERCERSSGRELCWLGVDGPRKSRWCVILPMGFEP